MTHDISELTRRYEAARAFAIELRETTGITARMRVWRRIDEAGVRALVEDVVNAR